MERRLLDFIDIVDFTTDEENQVGLITLRRFDFLDIQKIDKTIIKSRGEKFTKYDSIQEMIDSKETENVFAYNDLYQVVFAVSLDTVRTFCDASSYVIGLEAYYETKHLQYVTKESNATYDLIVRTSRNGELVYDGKNMAISEIANVMKILDNKSSLGITGYNIYKIVRSMEVKE